MTRPTFTEALEGVLGAATMGACKPDKYGRMLEHGTPDGAALCCVLRRALARWESRQRLRDDASLVKRIDNQVRFSGYAEPVVELFEELVFGGLGGTTGTTATKEG